MQDYQLEATPEDFSGDSSSENVSESSAEDTHEKEEKKEKKFEGSGIFTVDGKELPKIKGGYTISHGGGGTLGENEI